MSTLYFCQSFCMLSLLMGSANVPSTAYHLSEEYPRTLSSKDQPWLFFPAADARQCSTNLYCSEPFLSGHAQYLLCRSGTCHNLSSTCQLNIKIFQNHRPISIQVQVLINSSLQKKAQFVIFRHHLQGWVRSDFQANIITQDLEELSVSI